MPSGLSLAGRLLGAFDGVLEALGGAFEAFEAVLEALGSVLEALGGALEAEVLIAPRTSQERFLRKTRPGGGVSDLR